MKHNPDAFYGNSCNDVEFNDYLLLGGGTDISPALYGETDFGLTQSPDTWRDRGNMASINDYVNRGKPIFGVCRGLQILDAAFGGKLIQHTSGHPHGVTVTTLTNYPNDEGNSEDFDNCKNCHHQVVDIFETKGIVIGFSSYQYKAFFGLDSKQHKIRDVVPQIVYWPNKKALAVQFHPEWHNRSHKMNEYLRGLIKELLGLENVL